MRLIMKKDTKSNLNFFKAEKFLEQGLKKKAFKIYRKCAKQGDYDCQHNLAYFYDVGIGVDNNFKKAIFWYKKAYSNRQMSFTAKNIAILYLEQKRYFKALKWFKKAIKCTKKENVSK